MFTRTAPRALALAFAIVAVTVLAIVAVFTIPVASAPTESLRVASCSEFATGNVLNVAGGVCYLPTEDDRGFPNIDTADYGTDIPRCESDDFNSTHLPRCYTESTDAVIVIDSTDTVIATLSK